MSRILEVSVNERLVGHLREAADLWAFEYDPEWSVAVDGFDLSPALPRSSRAHIDGASNRPVQWYFDNLLPEETLRSVLAKEADVIADDAFGLLEYYGAESAGSLVLRAPVSQHSPSMGLRPLSQEALSKRIRDMPQASLGHDAPKKMSLAGAQHKLVVVLRGDDLFEPLPGTASTHILKPNHPSEGYPASVMNEYFTMRLAGAVGMNVPAVSRQYVPEPVYIVERFDRLQDSESVGRRHVIDACQLLNKSRSFKYSAANLETLAEVIKACRNRAAARLQIYRWLVFNVLVGNGDNHLKNLSFMVGPEGINLAPAYDLLSTAAYATRATASEKATWPEVELALSIGDARNFAQIDRPKIRQAGRALGLGAATVERELSRMARDMLMKARALLNEIENDVEAELAKSRLPEEARQHIGGELRLLRAITHIVIQDMVGRISD